MLWSQYYTIFLEWQTSGEKLYTGAVEIYFEMAHLLTYSTIFFRAELANPLYSFRLALQN